MVHRDQPVGVTKVSEGEGGGCIFFPQLAVISRLQGGRKVTAKKEKKGEKDEGKREKDDRNVPLRFVGGFFYFVVVVPCPLL